MPRLTMPRVRTLTGKEIELDIEPDYKVCFRLELEPMTLPPNPPGSYWADKHRQLSQAPEAHNPQHRITIYHKGSCTGRAEH